MAKPTVDGFTPNTVLKSGKKGLIKKQGSVSNVTVTGSNLEKDQAVTIADTKHPFQWTGNLKDVKNVGKEQQGTADVTQQKPMAKPIGPKDDPTSVSVTVGGSNPTNFNDVNTGDGP